MKKSLLSLLVGLLMLGLTACSSKHKTHTTNQNSELPELIDLTTFTDHACDLFASTDKDQNGFLNSDEQKNLPHWLKNADGKELTIMDVTTAAHENFKKFAKKNPNYLTSSEMKQMEEGL